MFAKFSKRTVTSLNHHSKWFRHTRIAIVGGGTGAMSTCAQIIEKKLALPQEITVIDPKSEHHYQPSYTMVAGGVLGSNHSVEVNSSIIRRPISSVFDENINLIQDTVTDFDCDENTLSLQNSVEKYTYDFLIVAAGINLRYDLIEGAVNALDDDNCNVASMYRYDYAKKANRIMSEFRGGKVICTQPPMPIKCGGAPQKFLYLIEEQFRHKQIRNEVDLNFYTQLPVMFGVKKYGDALYQLALKKDINVHFSQTLYKIDNKNNKAYFKDSDGNTTVDNYDFLHIVPPQKPFDNIANACISDSSGFVNVNKNTLQSNIYPNVFAIGDCTNIPTAKTAAAVIAQTPILVKNLENVMRGNNLVAGYDGYTSCPIFVGDGKLMLAEFVFDGVPKETTPLDQSIPRTAFYYLKRNFFPYAYWNWLPKAQWFGNNLFSEPNYKLFDQVPSTQLQTTTN